MWSEVRDGYRYTGLVRPQLHLSVWHGGNPGMMVSHGIGAFVDITEQTYTRRNWNEIVKLTAEWTDEKIMEVAVTHRGAEKGNCTLTDYGEEGKTFSQFFFVVSKTVFPFVIIVGGEHNAIVHKK